MHDPYSARQYGAQKALADAHPEEYEALLAELGQPKWKARHKALRELARQHPAEYRRALTDQAMKQAIEAADA